MHAEQGDVPGVSNFRDLELSQLSQSFLPLKTSDFNPSVGGGRFGIQTVSMINNGGYSMRAIYFGWLISTLIENILFHISIIFLYKSVYLGLIALL